MDYNLKLKNLGWNFNIYKIGNDYWLTNPKIASRFLTNFSQLDGESIYYTFAVTPIVNTNTPNIVFSDKHDLHGFSDDDFIIEYNKFRWKINAKDYNNKRLTEAELKSILSKINYTIIRNPVERLKSGIIQILVEWFFDCKKHHLKNESFEHINMFNDYRNQNNYPIDWNILFNMFDDDELNSSVYNLDIINSNTDKIKYEWQREWSKFSECFITEIINSKSFDEIIDSNVHTKSFLHLQQEFLSDIGIYNELNVIDLSKLDDHRDIILKTIPNPENLANHFDSPRIKETNDMFKRINWGLLYKWIESSKLFIYEIHSYYTMLNKSNTNDTNNN